jgi:hypothetical protein
VPYSGDVPPSWTRAASTPLRADLASAVVTEAGYERTGLASLIARSALRRPNAASATSYPEESIRVEQTANLDASVALRAQSHDWVALLRLICRHGTRVLAEGRAKTLRKWVATFPAKFAADVPWVGYWSGAATISESPTAARALFGKAWMAFETRTDFAGQLLCAAGILETYQFEWTSFEAARDWTVRLEGCLAKGAIVICPETELRVMANWLFARTKVFPGLDPSVSCMGRMRPLFHRGLDVNQRLFAARSQLLALCSRADLEGVRAEAARIGLMLDEPGCTPISRVLALNVVAHGLWLAGAFVEADSVMRDCIRTAREAGVTLNDPLHHEVRQLLAFSLGHPPETLDSLFALQRTIHPGFHYGMSMLKCALAQQAMANGDHRSALNHAAAAVSRADSAWAIDAQLSTRLALSTAFALEGEHSEAARVLHEAEALVDGDPRELSRRDIELVGAFLALKRSDRSECRRLLGRSLSASRMASQAFARFPGQMAELCMEALRAGIAVGVVHELIGQYRLRPAAGAGDPRPRMFRVLRAVS